MKKKIMGLWIACICAVSMLLTGTVSHAEIIHETDLEKYILQEMSAAHVLGMSISIVSPNKELYCAAYGQAQNTDMDYVLGGTTKSLTATAVLHMAEVKDLSLDDTIADYLPNYQAVGDVTIRELLYQTSGISPEERMSDLQGLGTRGEFADANANYNLLGMIIEKVSDISYEEYISDTILDTLEMESTYSKRNDTGMDGTLLPAYQAYFGFPFATQYKYDKNEDWMQVPSGQMISDVKDMGKYLQVLLNHGGELLLGSSVEQMLYGDVAVADTNGKMFGGSASGGMGWLAKEINGQPVLYSAGITENYSTAMVLLPEKDLGIVMMFNSTDFLVGQQLINKLQEGILSIELEIEPEQIDRDIYMTWHGICDVIMVLLVLAAWMPILLMGVWCKHRRKKLFTVPGIIIDILIQLVLPTALLLILSEKYPIFLIKRMAPDIYYVGLAIILTLYLGAVIKIIAMVILRLLPQRAVDEATVTEETAATEITSEVVGTVKAATTRAKRDRMLETVRTGVLEKDDMVMAKPGNAKKSGEDKPVETLGKTVEKTAEDKPMETLGKADEKTRKNKPGETLEKADDKPSKEKQAETLGNTAGKTSEDRPMKTAEKPGENKPKETLQKADEKTWKEKPGETLKEADGKPDEEKPGETLRKAAGKTGEYKEEKPDEKLDGRKTEAKKAGNLENSKSEKESSAKVEKSGNLEKAEKPDNKLKGGKTKAETSGKAEKTETSKKAPQKVEKAVKNNKGKQPGNQRKGKKSAYKKKK